MGRKNERIGALEKRVAELEEKIFVLEQLLPEFKDKVKPTPIIPDVPNNPWPPTPLWPTNPTWPNLTDRFCSVCGRDQSLAGSACYRTDCPTGFSPVGPTWTRD